MTKYYKKLLQKVVASFYILSFVFQPLLVAGLALPFSSTPVIAQDAVSVEAEQVNLEYSDRTLTIHVDSSQQPANAKVVYKIEDHDAPVGISGITFEKTDSGYTSKEQDLANSCSNAVCVDVAPTEGEIYFGNTTEPTLSFEVIDDVFWYWQGKTAIATGLEVGQRYQYPDNSDVAVTFTSLPDGKQGRLYIETVHLSPEQQEEVGAVSDTAYDISTNLENETFTYTLALPRPKEAIRDSLVLTYSDSIETLSTEADIAEISEVTDTDLTAKDLHHFTVFVVTEPPAFTSTCVAEGATTASDCYDTIQGAIDAAIANGTSETDTIEVRDGNYAECLNLPAGSDKIHVVGESQAGVSLDTSSCGYGVSVTGSTDVAFSNMTVTGSGSSYTFKIADSTVIELKNISVDASTRSAFDLNGVTTANLENLTATNTTGGVGIGLSDSNNVNVHDITTSGNAWGGLGIFTYGRYYPGGSDNMHLYGTNSLSETNPVYTEVGNYTTPSSPYPITNLNIEGFDYRVTNDQYRAGAANFAHYQSSLTNASNFALALHSGALPVPGSTANTASVIQQVSNPDFWVVNGLKIQEAIDAATGGEVLHVLQGTYNENLTVDKPLNIRGFNADINPVTDTRAAEAVLNGQGGTAIDVQADDVTLNGFTVTNATGTSIIYTDMANTLIENNIIKDLGSLSDTTNNQAIYVHRTTAANTTIQNNKIFDIFSGNKSVKAIFVGDSTASPAIQGVLISGNEISNIHSTEKGGYGILINHLTESLSITNNSIHDLDGLWAHAIGLEGDTPNASVTGNTISNIVDHKSPSDAVGIMFEDNPSTDTVTVTGNTFTATPVNIQNVVAGTTADVRGNTWSVSDQNNLDQIEAVMNQDCDNSPNVHGACGTGDNASYGFIKYADLAAPTHFGSNEKNSPTDPYAAPRPDVELACGDTTNINGISFHWSDVATGSGSIKYQRQYKKAPATNWSGSEIYSNPYTNFRTFGGGAGSPGTYFTQVRAFVDGNTNGKLDSGEQTSEWSDECSAVFDPNFVKTRTISGMKFNDLDGDTTKDDFEQGLENWTIKATYATPAATIQVDSTQPAGTDTPVLPAGQYLFVVSGEWTNRNNAAEGQDAEYRTTDDWVTHTDGTNADLLINNQFVSWGPYSDDHTYYYNFTQASDSAVNFSVFDGSGTTKIPGWYGDNNGSLTVQVFRVIDETTTDGDGNYTLTIPTSISQLRVYELQKENWAQTYPNNPKYHALSLTGYDNVTDVDFGNRETAHLSSVTMCKMSNAEEALSGWTLGLATAAGDDQTVPVDGNHITSRTLQSGDQIIFANGYYNYSSNTNWQADAGFSHRFPPYNPLSSTEAGWVSGDNLNTDGALEVKLNNQNVSWMPFSPQHMYTYFMSGFTSGVITAGDIYDNNYSDNSNTGNLRVRFETVYASGETDGTGCITFSDVPYGQYTPFEIMQPDWQFDSVSMDGTVYTTQPERLLVDETTEEVTYTNTFTGEEEEPEATPTPTPSPTPSPTPTVTPEPSPTATPSATPTPTPQVLGTSTSSSSSSSSSSSGGGSVKAPVCSATVPVGAPNLTVTQTSPNTVSLSWTGVEPTTHYALFFSRNDGELYGASNIGKTTTYTVNNLAPGFTYDFQVLGVNDCAPGDRSNTASSAQITGGIVEGRPVGDGGQVLGVDTEEPSEEQSEESTNETSETETAGTVLGASAELCAASWFQYLPLIMLVVLGVIVLVLEILIRRDISRKLIPIAIVTIMTLVLFYWLRDCNCTTEAFSGLIDILCTWFWLVAAFEVLLLRAIGYAFIDDAN